MSCPAAFAVNEATVFICPAVLCLSPADAVPTNVAFICPVLLQLL
jgi:hypothetical protein